MNALIAFLLLLVLSAGAQADSLGLHVGTWHERSGYNNVNPGLSYRRDAGEVVGFYCNSESRSDRFPNAPICRVSVYAGQDFRLPLRPGVDLGLVVGLVSGYRPDPVMVLVSPHVSATLGGVEVSLLYLPKPNPKGTQAISLMLGRSF
jgi:hypothetical protein